jgi:hypothetical protein
VTAIVPISDRRARLAFLLAILGLPSMGVTLPAAVWFGVGSVRQRRLSSGGEPALGFLSIVIAGLAMLAIGPATQRLVDVVGPRSAWSGAAAVLALAASVLVLASFALRIHPERWAAVLAARAGLVTATAGGAALFARTVAVIG